MDPYIKVDYPLREGIDINEIQMRRGTTFSTDLLLDDIEALDLNDDVMSNVNISNLNDLKLYFSTDDFSKVANEMISLDENEWVKKKIISPGGGHRLSTSDCVKVFYAAFWEKEEHPFDWKIGSRPQILMLDVEEVLPGMELAIHSMEIGEQAIFLISYQLMYGKLGIPPRIRSKETCLVYLHLVGLADAEKSRKHNDKNTFQWSHKLALQHHKFGMDFTLNQNYKCAAICFQKAVNLLDKSRLADEEEEIVQTKFLKKLYYNLAVAYNKQNQPKKACLACNRLNYLNALWNNPKALYQNACSLIMLEEYADAGARLKKAASLKPGNMEINDGLRLIEKKRKIQQKREMSLKKLNFNMNNAEEVSNEFREEITRLCLEFLNDPNTARLTLPPGLNPTQMDCVREIAEKYGLMMQRTQPECKTSIDKETDKEDDLSNEFFT